MNAESLTAARSIALVLPKNLTDEVVGAAVALALFFKKEHREVGVFSESAIPERWKCLDCSPLRSPVSQTFAEHTLIIDTAKHPIKEMRYEKDEEKNRLRIVLALTEGARIRREDITVETPEPAYGSIVMIGAKNIASIGSVWQTRPDLFYEKQLIPIYSETDLETTAEKTSALMKNISQHPYTPAIATALLFSLFAETDSLKKFQTASAETLASELIAREADYNAIAETLTPESELAIIQLCGRACARSKIEETPHQSKRGAGQAPPIFWSVLTAEDFLTTRASPSVLPLVVERMKKTISLPPMAILLYQRPREHAIRPIIISSQRNIPHEIKPEQTYPTFLAAEEHIRTLLENILRNEIKKLQQ